MLWVHQSAATGAAWVLLGGRVCALLIFFKEEEEQVAQRGCRCPIPGNIQGQVGRGSEHPDLVEYLRVHCRGVGLDDL